MHYLVTGGAGFIGSNLSNKLLKKGHEVTVIDDLSMGKKENLVASANLTFIEGSVTDQSLMKGLISSNKFDYIFHLAAVASVADSVERPVETHEVNYSSALNLLELVRVYQPTINRIVFASSAAVYGDDPVLPKTENSIINPLTPYAVDKYAAERTLLNAEKLFGIKTSATRFFNVYGPNQNPSSPYSGVISILLDRVIKTKNGEKVMFTLFGDGEQTRDFVFVEDVLDALLLVAESEETIGEVYNVGTAINTNLNTVISTLNEILNVKLDVIYQEARKGDIKDSYASIDKLKQLGYEPKFNIKQGLEKLVAHEMKNNH
ncbi:NAD-dependent epimerase/dehydratase family protein [Vagococcus zengguangii]|uniref:NAD-dependent epimerase/dehydratase family protein n=1 Tax=Vagococcus zengguangii TaxID=2571750 RepID=A0A4D7CS97_9ENTE|nr:NAD-dependent epimerase/dehydratase family protein [Vagococcus zengguangii]QCI87039.1 NAD-dependent epimerase/dehydratase family protein [Vagococcus zengguangii]